MADRNDSSAPRGKEARTREDRLKAALRANLARRKAQNRLRAGGAQTEHGQPGKTGKDKDA